MKKQKQKSDFGTVAEFRTILRVLEIQIEKYSISRKSSFSEQGDCMMGHILDICMKELILNYIFQTTDKKETWNYTLIFMEHVLSCPKNL